MIEFAYFYILIKVLHRAPDSNKVICNREIEAANFFWLSAKLLIDLSTQQNKVGLRARIGCGETPGNLFGGWTSPQTTNPLPSMSSMMQFFFDSERSSFSFFDLYLNPYVSEHLAKE